MAKKQRNVTLDVLKLTASYFVVFIHVRFYGEAGNIISALARFAVPVFFMTSGYYCYGQNRSDIKRKMLKIVKILIFASVLYNLSDIAKAFVSDGSSGVASFFTSRFSFKGLFELLAFNVPFSATRLWFLLALIYVYAIQYLSVRLNADDRVISVFSVILLILNLILGEGAHFLGAEVPEHYVRNFLLTGYPFFGFGLFYKKHNKRISEINPAVLWSVFFAGIVFTLLSPAAMDGVALHCGAVLMTFSLFALAISKADAEYPVWLVKLTGCSLGIYIFHRPVADAVYLFSKLSGLPTEGLSFLILYPLTVCVLSTPVSLAFNKAMSICKKHRLQRKTY